MRIGLVVNRFPVLSETFIDGHAAGLQAADLDVTVVAARPGADEAVSPRFTGPVRRIVLSPTLPSTARELASHFARRGGRDREMWSRAVSRYGRSRRAVRAWLIALALADFDVLHIEYSGVGVSYIDALRLLSPETKLVVSCRGTAERITPRIDPRRAEELRELFSIVDRVHCVTADMARVCSEYGLDRAKVFVNHAAVDATMFARPSPYVARERGPFSLLTTGRLQWAKGVEYAVLAVAELVERGWDVYYDLVGGGPEEDRLKFAAHDLKISSRVRFHGASSRDAVRAALSTADVYVSPSVSEGVSNAALEAMAMGVPIVSTDVGGMSEAIRDGIDGVLAPSRHPASIANAIEGLLRDPVRRVALSAAARTRVLDAFSPRRQISNFIEEYRVLVKGPR
ncbi:MAG: glycosyltransferase family 4 protein [Kofleriaceae bacterium]